MIYNETSIFDQRQGRLLRSGDDFTHMFYRRGNEKQYIPNGKIAIKGDDAVVTSHYGAGEIKLKTKDIISWQTASKHWD